MTEPEGHLACISGGLEWARIRGGTVCGLRSRMIGQGLTLFLLRQGAGGAVQRPAGPKR